MVDAPNPPAVRDRARRHGALATPRYQKTDQLIVFTTEVDPLRAMATGRVIDGPATEVGSVEETARLLGSRFGIWSGREDLNLDSFPGREACCNYTTSAKPASDEPDTFVV